MIGSTRSEQQWLERIEANREHLRRLAGALDRKLGPAAERGVPFDSMDDGERAELLSGRALLEVLAENRAQIEHALERLDAGLYGRCEDCGDRIDEERLAFRPESTRCLDCQRGREGHRRIA